MKIYISGKITGIEKEAPALFENAEIKLLKEGHEIVNPMKLEHNHDLSWESYMRTDLKAMLDCDAVYCLKNFKDSRGAIIETELAQMLGLKLIYEE